VGLISNIVREMKKELGENVKVIGTGGFSSLIFDELESIDYHDSELVLQGLRLIYDINRK
jgi:type III pantothenate kinase